MKRTHKKENVKTIIYSISALCLCAATLFGFWESNKDNRKAEPIKDSAESLENNTIGATSSNDNVSLNDNSPVNDKVDNIPDDRTYEETTLPKTTKAPAIYFANPLENGITREFSNGELVKNNTTGDWRTHNGADYKGVKDDPVKSICDGTVTEVSDSPIWGITVQVDHGNSIVAIYKGLKKGTVPPPGTKLKANDKIGNLGEIPIEKDDGPHLHLEIYRDNKPVSPKDYTGKTIQF